MMAPAARQAFASPAAPPRPGQSRPGEGEDDTVGRLPVNDITDTDLEIYQYAVHRGHIHVHKANDGLAVHPHDVGKSCDKLLRLRVLSDDDGTGLLTPVHPDTARVPLNERLRGEIKQLEQIIEQSNHQLRRITEALANTAHTGNADVSGVRVVLEPAQVQHEIDAAVLRCTKELVTARMGTQINAPELRKDMAADVVMLKRGVARRILYQHIARTSLGIRSSIDRLCEHGGFVRTTSESFDNMLIFDRRIAFVPFEAHGNAPPGAAIITQPVMVQFIHRIFERLWSSAMPWECGDPASDLASAENRVALLRLMASGLKDEAIAHRLGIATRTCRRHMTAVMETLGAASRIQAGVKIAQLGILPPDEKQVKQTSLVDAHAFC